VVEGGGEGKLAVGSSVSEIPPAFKHFRQPNVREVFGWGRWALARRTKLEKGSTRCLFWLRHSFRDLPENCTRTVRGTTMQTIHETRTRAGPYYHAGSVQRREWG
jgi:hypothetical protein